MELDLQVSPEEITSREVELGCESWTSLRVVRLQQCNGHCLCDSAQTQQLKQQLRRAQVARCTGGGPRSLRSFSGGIRGRAFTLSPSSPLSPSLTSNLAAVDVKQHGQGLHISCRPVFRFFVHQVLQQGKCLESVSSCVYSKPSRDSVKNPRMSTGFSAMKVE